MFSSTLSRFLGSSVLILLLVVGHPAFSQIPHTLSYQGILADTAGTPKPDGSYNFTFRLYTISSGGAAIWSETKSTQVKHGLFSTILGSVTPIPDSVRFDRQYWLGVQVASDPELSPRMQLSSVGSSMNSLRADVAQTVPDGSITTGKIATGQVVKSINNLHDNLTMRGANGAAVTTNGDTITVTASGGGGGGISTIQNTDNALSIVNPAGPTTTVNVKIPFAVNGNMGVGTTTPQGLLDVNSGSGGSDVSALFVRSDPGVFGRGGIIHHQSSTYGWQELAQTTSSATDGYLAFHYVNRTAPGTKVTSNVLTLRGNGNVGIGTTTPTSRLEIAAQDGLAITGFNPFLTLRDANAGNARGVIQGVNGGLNLFANSYLVGSNPTAFIRLDDNGHVGIGLVPTTTSGKLDVNGGSGNGASIGVHGSSNDNYGVYGSSNTSFGVYGESGNSPGVRARTYNPSSYALFADYSSSSVNFCGLSSNSYAIYANGPSYFTGAMNVFSNTTNYISGSLHITGNLDVSGSKNFRIDHPLDPANKTLTHACIESNERLLIYSGTVVTGASGDATIQLPSYFEALNINYRYQLTIVGEEFAQSRVSKEISNNQFSIKTDKPNIKVCWQVTGDRNDAFSKSHPLVAEEDKQPEDRGKYFQPELFGQTEEMRIGYRPPPAHPQIDHASPPFPVNKEKQ